MKISVSSLALPFLPSSSAVSSCGLGKFHFFPFQELREIEKHLDEFPLILTTGRILGDEDTMCPKYKVVVVDVERVADAGQQSRVVDLGEVVAVDESSTQDVSLNTRELGRY